VPLALRDYMRQQTHLFVVPVGTSLRQVMAQAGIPSDGVILRRGDVLHENVVPADAIISGGELIVHALPGTTPPIADPCIRCSWCIESCPTRIQPAGLLEASQRDDLRLGRHYGLGACIVCGVCTYVCPSHLPLLAGIRQLKRLESQAPEK
jgi:electron transport complex protein RnfC